MKRKTHASFNHQLTFLSARPRKGRWVVSSIALMLVIGVLTYRLPTQIRTPAPEAATPSAASEAPAVAAAPPAPEPPPVVKTDIDYVVRPNDTLGQIFQTLGLDVAQVPAILGVPGVRDRFKQLKPGDRLAFALENGALHGISRRVSETEVLTITRGADGFAAEVAETPIQIKTAQVRGTINASLFITGRAVGLAPEMVQQLANDIFAWDVDFALGVRPGDRFNIIYEQKYRGDEYLGDGRIIAAEFVNDGVAHRAVRYVSADGKLDAYFAPDGHSVRRQFLRAPIDITRVSAPVTAGGRRPILTMMRDHEGVDYAAPVGTVVKAAGDGRIKFIGERGEYGNTVIIDHGGKVSTLYAHLSAFARDLQANRPIKQGETIGFVGNTGAATAPHLHYEYRVDGTYTDPQTAKQTAAASIPAEYLADFRTKSAALLERLDRPGDAVVTASLAN